jgi:hypothetical protein
MMGECMDMMMMMMMEGVKDGWMDGWMNELMIVALLSLVLIWYFPLLPCVDGSFEH